MRTIYLTALTAVVFHASDLVAQAATPGDSAAPKLTAEEATNAPLFASHDLLALTLEAPFRTVFKEREQESSYHPAVLRYEDENGTPVSIDLRVKTRGKFRLDRRTCNFPPIRLNFPRSAVANTVFAHQDGVKLVTHCQDKKSQYEQQLLLEYLTYRSYNLISDMSFRVRLARITYVDTERDDEPLTRYAFVLEHDDFVAARSGWEGLYIPGIISPDFADAEYISRVELFNYMIGNTDFSAFMPPEDDECCHNVKLFGTMAGPVLPVPYDFDFAGIVNAPYAKPPPQLRIRSVRDRLWRGFCRPRESLDNAVSVFQEKKDEIYALFREQEGLEEKYVKRTIDYLDKFYEILDDPEKVTKEFVDKCRTR